MNIVLSVFGIIFVIGLLMLVIELVRVELGYDYIGRRNYALWGAVIMTLAWGVIVIILIIKLVMRFLL